MNKFFAALMTLIIIVTVVVVFGLGVMSLGGMSSDDSAAGRDEGLAGQDRLKGQSDLISPALWQKHFDTFNVDIAQWDWTAARHLNTSHLTAP